MTVTAAIDSMYEVFGIPNNSAAPEIMRRRIFNDLNSSMQLLWTKGHKLLDYYTRRELQVSIPSAGSATLPSDVQSVLDPVTLSGTVLRPLATKGEFINYSFVFRGALTPLPAGTPEAYYISALRSDPVNTVEPADATTLVMFVTPSPTSTVSITAPVALRAPAFTTTDYTNQTPIPIPHDYAETILLPIARYVVCSSLFFADKAKQREPLLKAEYERALQTLGESK